MRNCRYGCVFLVATVFSGAPASWSAVPVEPGPAAVPAPVQDVGTAADGPQFAVPTTYDRAGRIVAEVHLGEHGPFRFILDTGANRSALSESLASELALVPTKNYLVHGITGSAVMPVVVVERLRVGELKFGSQQLAILPDAVFAGTAGILGIDLLQKAFIDVDFENDQVTVRRAGRAVPEGLLVVRARLRRGGLLAIPGQVGKIRVSIIIDTGAERTLGNEQLRAALAGREAVLDGAVTRVVGATAQEAEGYSFTVPTVDLGGGAFVDRLRVTFGDFHVFKIWSLVDKPALLVGMDALGTIPRFGIDYPRRRFLLGVENTSPPTG